MEYFGENPKTSPPTTFFPMFMRFIKAYKVGGDGGFPVSGGWEGTWGPGGDLTPLWGNQKKPHVRLGGHRARGTWGSVLPFGVVRDAGAGLG